MMDKETTTLQYAFEAQMAKEYSKDPPTPGGLWDPVLHVWRSPDSGLIKASHLFPSRQKNFMNSIFGDGARADLFSPCNGLYLHPEIKKALHSGYIAIVPDVEIDHWHPWWDISNLSQSIKVVGWDKHDIQDYKVVVFGDEHHPFRPIFSHYEFDIHNHWDFLDGRKLIFQTDYRPSARYVWWTYLNTVMHIQWRSEDDDFERYAKGIIDLERAAQYWRTYGHYAKRSQILGFIEHLDYEKARDFLNEGYEDDDGIEDARPEAVEALLLEVIARSEQNGDDDYDTDVVIEDDDDVYSLLKESSC